MSSSYASEVERRDERIRRWGRRSWSFVGIVVAALVVYSGLALVTGLVLPLVVAAVVGTLFVPLVDRLTRFVPRPVAAAPVLVVLAASTIVVLVVAVAGVVDQAGEIARRIGDGYDELVEWLADLGFDVGDGAGAVDASRELWAGVVPGLTDHLGSVFSSTAAFLAGTLVAIFFLYFVLADFGELVDWVAAHLGVPEEVGSGIIDDATWAMRQYFLALSVASVLVAALVGLAAGVLGLPLAFTIAVVTFMTSYVPYLGAIFSGAFAVLIAIGSGGVQDAVIMLVVVLVAQNIVQTIVQTKLTEGRLKLHPIVIFGSTIAGGALFGLLGAALSTPLVAIGIRATRRLREVGQPAPGADG